MNKGVQFRLTLEDITSQRPAALHFYRGKRDNIIALGYVEDIGLIYITRIGIVDGFDAWLIDRDLIRVDEIEALKTYDDDNDESDDADAPFRK